MKKRNRRTKLRSWMVMIITSLSLLIGFPLSAYAQTSQNGSISMSYVYDNEAIRSHTIELYQVATGSDASNMNMVAGFTGLSSDFQDLTKWSEYKKSIQDCIDVSHLTPYKTQNTNDNGLAYFDGLEDGIYYVPAITVGNIHFDSTLIRIPTDGTSQFDCHPKGSTINPESFPIHYSVTKLWDDAGHESVRPSEVTVEIYCNATLYRTITLSQNNDWKYSWTSEDASAVWTVAEKNVPKPYVSSQQQQDDAFYIKNTYQSTQTPNTSVSSSRNAWILLLSISAILFIAITLKRNKVRHSA